VRYHDFTTITRSHSEAATRDEANIRLRAVAVLDKTEAGRRPIRLLGVSVHNLTDGTETSLRDFVEGLCGSLGIPAPTKKIPPAVAFAAAHGLYGIFPSGGSTILLPPGILVKKSPPPSPCKLMSSRL